MTYNDNGRLRAVFIDFGGVLYNMPRPGWLPLMFRLLRLLRLNSKASHGLLELMRAASPTESEIVMDVMTGRLAEEEVWEQAARAWRLNPARVARLRQSAYRADRLDRSLLEAVDALRPRFKTAMLTNAASRFRETFVHTYDLEPHFDQIIISAEEGLAKPDPRIYQLAAERLGVAPEKSFFIDDLPENIAGAQAAGMQAVLFTSGEEVVGVLRGLG